MRLLSLISGGIDSPVASYVMAERGAEIVLLHMDNRPYSDDLSLEKVKSLAVRLREVTGREMPLYSAPHGGNQRAVGEVCDPGYQCVMCKRLMQRTARQLAIRSGCSAVVMGDSLGQVASQTLRNIRAENTGLRFPVLRPLIGWDKQDIERTAKMIGTYEISITPSVGCTALPARPVTEARPERISAFEESLDLDALAESSAAAAAII